MDGRKADASTREGGPVLAVRDLAVAFSTPHGLIRAVDGVSFDVRRGDVLAIVGESGSGKSVTGLSLLKLIPAPGEYASGEVRFGGDDLLRLGETAMEEIRGRRIGMVFQNPRAALDPAFTVTTQMEETIRRHHVGYGRSAAEAEAVALLRGVGFRAPEHVARSYPHQLSGGMCQRVALALALCGEPELLIADEPTTALDVVVQASILALLKRIHRERDLPIILITHDFGVVRALASRVAVMYAGLIQEDGAAREVLSHPQHPYTRALIASVPSPGDGRRRLAHIEGAPPDLSHPPRGCRFAPRCGHAFDRCHAVPPPLLETSSGARVRCHLHSAGPGVAS